MTGDDYSRTDPRSAVARFHAEGTGLARIGYPILLTRTTLARRTEVTPSMLRLTLTGPELAGFHTYQADDHVRLVLALPDGSRNDPVPNDRAMLDWPRPSPPARKYTVRRFDAEALELDLDVVVHTGGVASQWAASVRPGEQVVVAGPPGAKVFPHTYDHYVLAVDTTGLPAAARWLEEAPDDVSAHVLVDHDHAHERDYPFAARPGVEVRWLDRSAGSRLAEGVAALPLPSGRTFLFGAGEAGDIAPLRRWASTVGIDALVTGYWKRGVADLDE